MHARLALKGRGPALIALAIAAAVSCVFLIGMDAHLTFVADDWMLLVKRQGWGASYFLKPFHGSIIVGPALVYKILRAIFGLDSATPYYVAAIATFAASAGLLFVYLRRRVGDWLALIAAILVLFLGAAFEDLLFAFQIGYFAAVAAGLGMLIALDREDERGDRIACGLLVVSVAFSSVGLAFLAAALVDLALGRRPRARRAFVVLLPVALFALWWVFWGHTAQSHVSLHNILATPKFVFDSASAGIASLLGLASNDGSEPSQPHLIWGKLVLIGGLVLLAVRIVRDGKMSRGLAIALAAGLTFWILAGVNRDLGRFPTSSRYQYPSAVFLLLIAAEMLRGLRLPKLAVAAAAVVTGLALSGGISLIHREYTERWQPYSDSLRSSLAAVQIAGPSAEPHFPVSFPPETTVSAREYLATVAEYGSPAYSEAGLEARPEAELASADLTMAQALGLSLGPPRADRQPIACQGLRASVAGTTGLTLLHGGFTLENEGSVPVEVMLSRFANELSVSLGPLEGGGRAALRIPTDDSPRPWVLGLKGAGPVRLCTTTSG